MVMDACVYFNNLIKYIMLLTIHTDGGSKGNPGPSAIGVVFYCDGHEVFTYREDIGIATNNIAEYTAVIRAFEKSLEYIKTHPEITEIQLYSDSSLVVNQLKGLFKIKEAHIGSLILKVKNLEKTLQLPISYFLVPREKNKKADELVNNIIE
jgi:ribonuclease HI